MGARSDQKRERERKTNKRARVGEVMMRIPIHSSFRFVPSGSQVKLRRKQAAFRSSMTTPRLFAFLLNKPAAVCTIVLIFMMETAASAPVASFDSKQDLSTVDSLSFPLTLTRCVPSPFSWTSWTAIHWENLVWKIMTTSILEQLLIAAMSILAQLPFDKKKGGAIPCPNDLSPSIQAVLLVRIKGPPCNPHHLRWMSCDHHLPLPRLP